VGAPIVNTKNTTVGYQEVQNPNLWYGLPLSTTAGSIALMDASNTALVDGMVYGSRQSNSSANGTIASPEIATLEGDQSGGGCIVVVPTPPRGFQQAASTNDQTNRSYGRFPDGLDNDNNCSDFLSQNSITLALPSVAGSNNIKVASVADFNAGQQIIIGSGNNSETAIIANIGTPGGTAISIATEASATVIPVVSVAGFSTGQTIIIGSGSTVETAVIASLTAARRRFGNTNNNLTDTITVTTVLKHAHAVGEQVSGSGIILSNPLTKAHESGTQVSSYVPTPGQPNRYVRKL
jgi:hypothetical protein